MTNAAHTPGPWEIDDRDPDAIEIVGRPKWECTRLGERGKWDVCRIDDLMGDYPKEVEANARLIASAPDLLDALSGLLAVYAAPDEQLCCNGRDCGCMGASAYQEVEHYARAAIAKATGGAA